MYVVGLMYQSGLVAATVKRALCAEPDVDVHVLPPPSGHRGAGHLDVLITDCTEADLLADAETESDAASLPDVMLVVSDRIPDGAEGVPGLSHFPATLSAVVQAAVVNAHTGPLTPEDERVLSKRERQVLRSIGEGLTHDQTARRLGISPHTVDTYVKRVRGKLRVGNKAELTRAALRYA